MTTFAEMFEAPLETPKHAFVIVNFARPDGDPFSSTYDMLSRVDIETINKNLRDGYRVTRIEAVGY